MRAPHEAVPEVPVAVPYGRKSRAKSRMQRAANMKYAPKAFVLCGDCKAPKLPHYACGQCGSYAGRQARPLAE